jgi:hypothetical protein
MWRRKDNDGNGQVDANCNVSNIHKMITISQVEPEKEVCGDGKDNKCKVSVQTTDRLMQTVM